MFSDEMKAERVGISRKHRERFEKDGEELLKKIITGDETWVHHCDPENKRQSMEYAIRKTAIRNTAIRNTAIRNTAIRNTPIRNQLRRKNSKHGPRLERSS